MSIAGTVMLIPWLAWIAYELGRIADQLKRIRVATPEAEE